MDKGKNFLDEREKPGQGSGRVTPPIEIQISIYKCIFNEAVLRRHNGPAQAIQEADTEGEGGAEQGSREKAGRESP